MRSGRVAICVPTNSIVTDDGAVVRRVNLIRPTANEKMSVEQFQSSTWKVINQDTFQSLWQQEVNQSPEFEVNSFYLITGLLLPIWNRLDGESLREMIGWKLRVFILVNDKVTGIIEKIRQLA